MISLDLTQYGGQTRVSDGSADEGGPHSAGVNTKLSSGAQGRGCSAGAILTEKTVPQIAEEIGVSDNSLRSRY